MKQVYITIHLMLSILLLSLPAWSGPGRTTYQAKIIKPDGSPLEAGNVNFKFTILDPAGTCILYSETFSAVNMSSTGGLISFSLGSGVKTYPVSATTFEQVFSNITSSLSCDTGGPANYSPSANDIRKIVMQFHDGSGWQTLPAMAINAVPYAMYANEAQKLNGLTSSDFVQISTVSTCAASEALRYTGAGFSCIAVGSGSGSVTSGSVITALGYTPASSTVLGSFLQISNNLSDIASATIARINLGLGSLATKSQIDLSSIDVSGTLSAANLADSGVIAATYTKVTVDNKGRMTSGSQFTAADVATALGYTPANSATVTSSQWNTSGTTINYMAGNVGIGTTSPSFKLEVSGSATSDRKIGITGKQILYLPDQSSSGFTGSLFVGDGGASVSHTSGSQGYRNTSIGIGALYSNTTGYDNTATGYQALQANADGIYNTANGKAALYSNISGSENTATGFEALYYNTYGSENAATGNLALQYNTTGSQNAAYGNYALRSNDTGNENTATGHSALYSNTDGYQNTANGSGALYYNTSGSNNTANGADALRYNTDGYDNTATGHSALQNNTIGDYNTANGSYALRSNTEGGYNTANGFQALWANTTGFDNTANGESALYSNKTGNANSAYGNNSLRSNTTGGYNIAIGNYALYSNTTGSSNTANGYFSLYSNKTKSESTAMGYYSMRYADSVSAAVTSSYNTAVGAYSLQGSITASINTGLRNTALGHSSLKNMTSGSSNTAVGYNAGSAITTGSNNVILGSDSGSSIATSSNFVLIADGAGNRRMTIDSSGNVGIGTTTSFTKLSVSGGVQISMESATCVVSYAGTLRYNSGSVEFCNSSTWTALGTGSVTSASVISALGYTPANDTAVTNLSSTVATSFTTLTSNINSVSSSVSSLATSTAASFAAMTPSQWNTSGTAINYMAGNVGIGTANPTNKLDVNGSMTVGWPNLASVPANSLIVNNRIGVGVGNPSYALQVFGPFSDPVALFAENAGSTNGAAIQISASESGAKLWEFRTGGSASVGGLGALTFTNKTDGKTALTILPAGNVGVGTNNPLAPLHILDNSGYGIKLTRTTAPAQNFGLRIDSAGVLLLADWTTGFGLLQRSTGNNEIVTNANPLDPSNIGNPLNYQLSIRNADSITGNGAGIAFSDSSSNGNAGGAILFKRNGSNSLGELQFYTKQSTVAGAAPSQVMVLTNTGNVGIGTSTPLARLDTHVNFSSPISGTIPGFSLQNDGNVTSGSGMTIDTGQGMGLTNIVGGAKIKSDGTGYTYLGARGAARILLGDGSLSLFTGNTASGTTDGPVTWSGSGSEALFINSFGNVGIGTTSLYSTFQVKTGTNQNVGIEGPVGAASGSTLNIFNDAHSANVPLEIRSSATYLGLVGGSNVGIGTTSPQTKLQVEGVISPATDNTHDLGASTYRFKTIYATNGTINTSDRREKKDIFDTNLGLSFINKLRPISYRWNTGIDDDIHYGLIAQEAEQAIVESRGDRQVTSIVTHDEKTDRYGVRYSELISPLIKAIQEMYSKLLGNEAHDVLQDQKIKKLEAENAELRSRLEKIEKRLESE